jgi:hypothetical protein
MNEHIGELIPNFQQQYEQMHKQMNAAEVISFFVRSYGRELTANAIDQTDICPAVPGLQLIDIYMRNRNTQGERI